MFNWAFFLVYFPFSSLLYLQDRGGFSSMLVHALLWSSGGHILLVSVVEKADSLG